MDYTEIQFCDDHGHCICGNDCGAGCCSTQDPCEGHKAARAAEREAYELDPWGTPPAWTS